MKEQAEPTSNESKLKYGACITSPLISPLKNLYSFRTFVLEAGQQLLDLLALCCCSCGSAPDPLPLLWTPAHSFHSLTWITSERSFRTACAKILFQLVLMMDKISRPLSWLLMLWCYLVSPRSEQYQNTSKRSRRKAALRRRSQQKNDVEQHFLKNNPMWSFWKYSKTGSTFWHLQN